MAGTLVVMRGRAPLAVAPALFIATFVVIPVAHVALSHLHVRQVTDVLTAPALMRVVWFSIWQATLSTIATIAIGLPATWVLARFSFPGHSLARGILSAPFVMPAVVIAAGVLAILPDGHNQGVAPIIWAHVIFNVAVVVRVVSPRWAMVDHRLEEASRVLGAGPFRTFTDVVLPQISDALVSAIALVFLFCFTSFGVISILGGFARRTIEAEIFIQSVRLGDVETATALALIQAVIAIGVLVLARRSLHNTGESTSTQALRPLRSHTGHRIAIGALVPMACAVVALPLAAVTAHSFILDGSWTLEGWRRLGTSPLPGLTESAFHVTATSLFYGVSTALVCVPLGLMLVTSQRRLAQALSNLPLVISSATLGIGIILTFNRDPFDWRSRQWLIPMIHAVIALPLVVRTIAPAHRAIPDQLRQAAAVLGASPMVAWWRVELPLLRPALLRASGLAIAVSLGEFGATSFLSRQGSTTLPIAIGQLLGRPGDVSHLTGFALAAIMVIVTTGVMSRA